jgi:hypothetical protein
MFLENSFWPKTDEMVEKVSLSKVLFRPHSHTVTIPLKTTKYFSTSRPTHRPTAAAIHNKNELGFLQHDLVLQMYLRMTCKAFIKIRCIK